MAGGIQPINQGQRSNPSATTSTAPEQQTTTVTTANGLTYYSADVPTLGGTPLIVQADSEEAVRRIYHRECAGLSPGANITVRAATELEIQRANEENRVKA